ncbi:MAG: hypothetical protein AB8I08_21885 [Sandaracinaceae bacterium]
MNAWPIEDIWLRPLVSAPLAALLPWLLERVTRAVAGKERAAGVVLRPTEAALAWTLGATALGPALVSSRGSLVSLCFGAACAILALGVGGQLRRVPQRRLLPMALVPAAAAVVGTLLSPDTISGDGAAFGMALVVACGVLGVSALTGASAVRGDRLSLGAGAGTAVMALGALALPWVLTDIEVANAPDAGTDASRWRLRVDPWDEGAMLGAAWASRKRNEPARAIAQAREAQRMGLDAASALELEAEVHATAGDCEAARAAFDRALRARAVSAFDEDALLTAPLTLGGFRLPPALVTECGGLDQLPGIGEAAGAGER